MGNTILDILENVKENVSLAPYTTFKIGGKARYFFSAANKRDVMKAVKTAKALRLPFFVLGGGSNVLVSDKGFDGLVIYMCNRKHKIEGTKVFGEAGVDFPVLVKETGKEGLSGLEWAGGLPGTLGGAVRGNAGAFKGEVKDNLIEVEILDNRETVRKLTNKQCRFSYRSSVFKKKNWIILSATFKLKKGNKKEIQDVAKEHIQYRKDRHPLEYPNAGSVFKNYDAKKIPKRFQKKMEHVVKIDPFPLVPTAYLISEAQLKGLSWHDAQVSKKHSNYIVNKGKARAKDVKILIGKVKKKIKEKFSVDLKEEITIL